MALNFGATFAGYRIVRSLGSGGMGEVYLAEHPRLPRLDAVKILGAGISADPDFRERFDREADLAATLFHANIVGVHDRGECDGQLWIAMDFVDGLDAALLLRRRYPAGMPLDEAVPIVFAIAAALDHAHGRGLLHRDVKPANILLTNAPSEDRRVMLADFGIARSLTEISGLAATNTALGTVDYAAPEQLMDAGVDGRADQYSLAATAYHLLTGSPPYRHSSPAVTISRHLAGEVPALSGARPDLAGLDAPVRRALSREADSRYPTCRHFADALAGERPARLTSVGFAPTMAAPVAAAPPQSPTPKPGSGPPPRPLRAPIAAAVAALGALAAVAAVGGLNQAPEAAVEGMGTAGPTVSTTTATSTRTTTVTAAPRTTTVTATPETTTVTATVVTVPTVPDEAPAVGPGRAYNVVTSLDWADCTRVRGTGVCLQAAREAAGAPFGAAAPLILEGSSPVPAMVGYGDYLAAVGPRGSCFWYGYDALGRLVDSGMAFGSATRVRATVTPTMATFQSHGCTPWFRVTPMR